MKLSWGFWIGRGRRKDWENHIYIVKYWTTIIALTQQEIIYKYGFL